MICQEVDAVLSNTGFQVQMEIQQRATQKCENLTETVACAKWIEAKGKEYLGKTGEGIDRALQRRVICEAMDDETQDAAEKMDLDEDDTSFMEVKGFIDKRKKKFKARKNLKKGANDSKMDTSSLDLQAADKQSNEGNEEQSPKEGDNGISSAGKGVWRMPHL